MKSIFNPLVKSKPTKKQSLAFLRCENYRHFCDKFTLEDAELINHFFTDNVQRAEDMYCKEMGWK